MTPQQEEEEEHHHSHRAKRKVLEDSGTTDGQRKKLRQRQLALARKIDHSTTLADLQKAREENNELFDDVVYAREAILDANNVNSIASKLSEHAERMVHVRSTTEEG
jgi:uncharacterized protein YigA (DUF484 family)